MLKNIKWIFIFFCSMAIGKEYAVTLHPTPLFNTPTHPFCEGQLTSSTDEQGLLRAVETILFPGSKVSIVTRLPNDMVEIETQEYTASSPLYLDARFLSPTSPESPERVRILPSREEITQRLLSYIGTPYFWGGTTPKGIPEMLTLYPHLVFEKEREKATCYGLDCSGLLYNVTSGVTPHSTSQLIHFGKGVDIAGLSVPEIAQQVAPLDLFVWKGHVLIILRDETQFGKLMVIESRGKDGVVLSPFEERIGMLMEKLTREGKPFFVRRWYPDTQ